MNEPITIDCDFPGGNILVDRIEENHVYLQPDLGDTEGAWFYWYFRVAGPPGQKICFHLDTISSLDLISSIGPAVSNDEGETWQWLGRTEEGNSFQIELPMANPSLRLCMAIPYTQKNLDAFLSKIEPCKHLVRDELTKSRAGRAVELLRVGQVGGNAKYRVLLTARSHCCETTASLVMEGILQRILDESPTSKWLYEHVEFFVIPFVDTDGVEQGDQGKNRNPHDHNRDFIETPLYPETRAIIELVAKLQGRIDVMWDLHCPWICGPGENIYNIYSHAPQMRQEQQRFSELLQSHCKGPLPYNLDNNLQFGESFNCHEVLPVGRDSSRWALTLPDIILSNIIEIPYAIASGVPVTVDNAREFGHNLTDALQSYLNERLVNGFNR